MPPQPAPAPIDDGAAWRSMIDRQLSQIAGGFGLQAPALGRAMGEAALSPGKRFRGVLLMMAGNGLTRCDTPGLLDVACAIELAHTASLIVDDLPSMDDAGLRRGRPTTHIAHGEARAILAGIALVSEALRLLAGAEGVAPEARTRLVASLAVAIGPAGLCAGQDLDLYADKTAASILREHDLKTGALFVAGFEMLGILLGTAPEAAAELGHLGRVMGRAFQSHDDLLDALSGVEATGKDAGQDGGIRGLMSVTTLQGAAAQYHALRDDVTAQLAVTGLDDALGGYIAAVLPVIGVD